MSLIQALAVSDADHANPKVDAAANRLGDVGSGMPVRVALGDGLMLCRGV